jgi:hypothetical protein
MKLEFSPQILDKYSDLIKVCPVGAELFHAGGHDAANSSFLQ